MDENTSENGTMEENKAELIPAIKVTEDVQVQDGDHVINTDENNGTSDTPELMVDTGSNQDTSETVLSIENKSDEDENDLTSETTEEEDDMSEIEEETDAIDQAMGSLQIHPDELGLFDDLVVDRDSQKTPDSMKALSEGSVDVPSSVSSKKGVYERKSDLHCALCGELCNDGKLLRCLHTFCLECLKKNSKEKQKHVLCPLCLCRTMKPDKGLEALPKSLIVTNIISAQSALAMDKNCVICKLGDKDTLGVARCIDCNDLLCEDCSGKHTFSRLTAKHIIVKLDGADIDKKTEHKWSNRVVYCKIHAHESLRFYCEKCSECACKDCILLNHSSHSYIDITDMYKKTSDCVINSAKKLQEEAVSIKEDFDDCIDALEREEKKQMKHLEDAKLKALRAVEKKFEHCVVQLQQEFKKKNDFHRQRKQFAAKTKNIISRVEENVNFILENGHSTEVISLESVLSETFSSLGKDVLSVSQAEQQRKGFPRVKINEDNIAVISCLSLFSVVKPKQRSDVKHHRSDARQKYKNRKQNSSKESQSMKSKSDKTNMPIPREVSSSDQSGTRQKITTQGQSKENKSKQTVSNTSKPKNMSNNAVRNVKTVVGGTSHSKNVPSVSPLPTYIVKSVGRGKLLESIVNTGSVPGEYPNQVMNSGTGYQNLGHQLPHSNLFDETQSCYHGQNQMLPENYPPNSFGWNASSMQHSNISPMDHSFSSGHQLQVERGMRHSETIRLKLCNHVNVGVLMEQSEPNVVGLAFTAPNSFAVSDAGNKRVKLFDIQGMFLTVVEDEWPLTITVCQDHLVWNSHLSDIQIYNLGSMKRFDCRSFRRHAYHPVTTFKGEKLLVANVRGSEVEAYTLEGNRYKLIHSLQPRDRDGRPLKKVTHIAAYSNDQLAIIDSAPKKVIVTDFDGNFIGEYCASNFDPGAVCIDHRGTIFVTNRVKSKLIALTSRGEFIQEWAMFIDSPTAVACNGRGLLLVAGQCKNVNIYQYE